MQPNRGLSSLSAAASVGLRTLFATSLAVVTFAISSVRAQDDATADKPPVEVKLTAKTGVVRIGNPIALELVVVANEATSVPASLLGGVELETSIDGRKSANVDERVDSSVLLAKGTTISRALQLDLATVWGEAELRDAKQITIRWRGFGGTEATLRVVPDQSSLDLTTLDYEATKVRFITSEGELVIGFLPGKAPKHVENFVKLARDGFYDGTRFHRILRGFMAQGGCPNTKIGGQGAPGTGGPGYAVRAEFNDTPHVRGIVSMARAAGEDTAGSQFFLMHGTAPHLDGKYSAFGRIEEASLQVLDRICDTPVRPNNFGEPSVPTRDVWLWAAIVEPVTR